MLCLAFIVCLSVLAQRRKLGVPIVIPLAVMVLGLVRLALLAASVPILMSSFKSVAKANRSDRAAILAASIDESMSYAWLGVDYELPLLLVAWLTDRQLRKRHRPKLPAAQPAPAGAHCASHTHEPATLICVRCGGFMCATCGQTDGSLCAPCINRG